MKRICNNMLRNKCRKIYLKINIILNAGGIYGKIGAFITGANTKYCVVHFLEYIFRTFRNVCRVKESSNIANAKACRLMQAFVHSLI